MATKYTKEEKDIIMQNYPKYGLDITFKMLRFKGYKRTVFAVKSACIRFGLKSCRSGKFQPGHTPYNKGAKIPLHIQEKMKPTWFKSGQPNYKCLPLCSTRKNLNGYWEIKVAMPATWRIWHQYLWEQHHGPIPPKHVVVFKDHNHDNICIDNLECISRAELVRRNRNIEKFRVSIQKAWILRKENKQRAYRKSLIAKYGRLSNALAMGEKLM